MTKEVLLGQLKDAFVKEKKVKLIHYQLPALPVCYVTKTIEKFNIKICDEKK